MGRGLLAELEARWSSFNFQLHIDYWGFHIIVCNITRLGTSWRHDPLKLLLYGDRPCIKEVHGSSLCGQPDCDEIPIVYGVSLFNPSLSKFVREEAFTYFTLGLWDAQIVDSVLVEVFLPSVSRVSNRGCNSKATSEVARSTAPCHLLVIPVVSFLGCERTTINPLLTKTWDKRP